MKTIIIIALIVVIIFLIVWQILLKRNIKQVRDELAKTKDENYDRQLKVSLMDKDVESLAAEINNNLEYQKALKKETDLSRRQLEQSISDIAHDLRTPLTVVKGNLQMLEKEDLSDKGREYLAISTKKADALKGMVDEFFELSVLESDSKPVELCKLDVVSFLSEFIIENETLIRQNDLTPEITFPEKSLYIQANKDMMNRVFNNLIGNIVKYAKDSFELIVIETDIDSHVDEAFGNDGKVCHIRIGNNVDPGTPIDVEHIFDRTYRADKARSDGSAGLGLYIAKLLVEKQKGSMKAVLEDGKLFFDIVFYVVDK